MYKQLAENNKHKDCYYFRRFKLALNKEVLFITRLRYKQTTVLFIHHSGHSKGIQRYSANLVGDYKFSSGCSQNSIRIGQKNEITNRPFSSNRLLSLHTVILINTNNTPSKFASVEILFAVPKNPCYSVFCIMVTSSNSWSTVDDVA